ncbi:hypothetical protein FRB99_008835, partial [Tulasnella sp. 403]
MDQLAELKSQLDELQADYTQLESDLEVVKRRAERCVEHRRIAEQQRNEAEKERDEWENKYWELRARTGDSLAGGVTEFLAVDADIDDGTSSYGTAYSRIASPFHVAMKEEEAKLPEPEELVLEMEVTGGGETQDVSTDLIPEPSPSPPPPEQGSVEADDGHAMSEVADLPQEEPKSVESQDIVMEDLAVPPQDENAAEPQVAVNDEIPSATHAPPQSVSETSEPPADPISELIDDHPPSPPPKPSLPPPQSSKDLPPSPPPELASEMHLDDPDSLEEVMLRRLIQCDVHDLSLDVRNDFHMKGVPLSFIEKHFGVGSLNYTYSQITAATQQARGHTVSSIFMPSLTWNPMLPQSPGHAGFAFSVTTEGWPANVPLVVVHDSETCFYLGDYEAVLTDPLTLAELKIQPVEKMRVWYSRLSRKRNAWGVELRARISFRKQNGREPTTDELAAVVAQGPPVPAAEIEAAFMRGEELMQVVCLKPIQYDEAFQRGIIAGYEKAGAYALLIEADLCVGFDTPSEVPFGECEGPPVALTFTNGWNLLRGRQHPLTLLSFVILRVFCWMLYEDVTISPREKHLLIQKSDYLQMLADCNALRARGAHYLQQRKLAERQRDEAERDRDEWERMYLELRSRLHRQQVASDDGTFVDTFPPAIKADEADEPYWAKQRIPEIKDAVMTPPPTATPEVEKDKSKESDEPLELVSIARVDTSEEADRDKEKQSLDIFEVLAKASVVEETGSGSEQEEDGEEVAYSTIEDGSSRPGLGFSEKGEDAEFPPPDEGEEEDQEEEGEHELESLDEAFHNRLEAYSMTDLEIKVRPHFHGKPVHPDFFNMTYGISPRTHTYSEIKPGAQKKHGHSYSRILLQSLVWSPWLPQEPGQPGFAFVLEWEKQTGDIPVIVYVDTATAVYMGEYEATVEEPLSLRELELAEEARKNWLARLNKKPWAAEFRARVWYRRKYGRAPTDKEMTKLPVLNIHVTSDDVEQAILRGDE